MLNKQEFTFQIAIPVDIQVQKIFLDCRVKVARFLKIIKRRSTQMTFEGGSILGISIWMRVFWLRGRQGQNKKIAFFSPPNNAWFLFPMRLMYNELKYQLCPVQENNLTLWEPSSIYLLKVTTSVVILRNMECDDCCHLIYRIPLGRVQVKSFQKQLAIPI